MGMPGIGISNCSCPSVSMPYYYVPQKNTTAPTPTKVTKVVNDKNPDPTKFNITEVSSYGDYLACVVVYPNCTNYEGKKILVMKCTIPELCSFKTLDPHFCDKGHISPIARFEPTEQGWDLALKMLDMLNGVR